jgi:NAD(P)H-dependent nitrite reductase large subunit/NAD(P)H-dependent nitrite reductase small subunit
MSAWHRVCDRADIVPNTGVCALIDGTQIAVFRLAGAPAPLEELRSRGPALGGDDLVYAIDNRDPHSGANVLSRGLVGDLKGELVVASPMYKQHYSLRTGRCLENPAHNIRTYPARIEQGQVCVQMAARSVKAPVKGTRAQKLHLAVIGNGMAGMRVVEELLELAPDLYRITVFGEEPHGSYNRILLSSVLAREKKPDEIMLNTHAWYAERGITLHSGDPVVALDRRRRVVKSSKGIEVAYDRVLLATGSRPITIPLPGRELSGVMSFRDLQDVDVMMQATRTHKRAVVIGGGLIGLEAATGLLKQGMEVSVIHLMDRLMERQLDRPAADMLKVSLEKRGLRFYMQAQTAAILGLERVSGVRLKNGTEIAADLLVMAVGIKPNIELAAAAGLRCERGVLVNDTLQTFDPHVYAVGECVQHRNATYGLVAPLWEHARVCAAHLAELGHARYSGSKVSTQLKVTGIDVFSAGDFLGGDGAEDLVLRDARRGIYKRLVIKDNKIRGAVLFGDARDGNWYYELMNQGADIGSLRDKLLFGEAYADKAA